MQLVLKLMALDLSQRELEQLKDVAQSSTSPRAKAFFNLVMDLDLVKDSTRQARLQQIMSRCNLDRLAIACRDNEVDLCPNGHLNYGLIKILLLALPGVLYALSEVWHMRSFGFGGVVKEAKGVDLPGWAFALCVPVYAGVMGVVYHLVVAYK